MFGPPTGGETYAVMLYFLLLWSLGFVRQHFVSISIFMLGYPLPDPLGPLERNGYIGLGILGTWLHPGGQSAEGTTV